MNKETDELVRALKNFLPAQLDKMPDIDLYKDQVITYLKKELALFQEPLDTELVTSSIINNYVKDQIVPRPVKKRYSKAQLAPLIMSCILKRALSMQQIKSIMGSIDAESGADVYERFCDILADTIKGEVDSLSANDASVEALALNYSLRACIDCTIADRLIKLRADKK